jgi:hypothetical protein
VSSTRSTAGLIALVRRPAAVIVLVWAGARALAYGMGVRFDPDDLERSMQIIDPALLRDDLWRSLWYSHAQPPGFNLFVGLVLRLPAHDAVFHACFLAMGLAIPLLILRILRQLGVRASIATGTAVVWCVLPASVLYETLLSYTLPTAFLLLVATSSLASFITDGSVRSGAVFAASLTGVAFLRSTYHLAWIAVPIVVLLLVAPRFTTRARLAIALTPLLLVAGLYAKNYVVFDQTSTSSWMGMNLARIAFSQTPRGDLRALQREGTLSPLATLRPFGPVDRYDTEPRGPDVPILRQERTSIGTTNYFHGSYVEISEQYLDDALAFIRARPGRYATAVGASTRFLFLPATDFHFIAGSRSAIGGWDRAVNAVLFLQLRDSDAIERLYVPGLGPPSLAQVQWTMVLAYGATAIGLPMLAVRVLRRRGPPSLARGVTMLFVAYTVLTVTLVNVLFEIRENNRFRFETDPLVLVAVGILLDAALDARRHGGAASRE